MLLYALLKRFEKHIGPSGAGSVELVLAEILSNIVEHAYGEESIGEVEVVADMLPEQLVCNVQDWGAPFRVWPFPKSALPTCGAGIETLPEGGWGWALIRTVASDLDYRRDAGTAAACASPFRSVSDKSCPPQSCPNSLKTPIGAKVKM